MPLVVDDIIDVAFVVPLIFVGSAGEEPAVVVVVPLVVNFLNMLADDEVDDDLFDFDRLLVDEDVDKVVVFLVSSAGFNSRFFSEKLFGLKF